MDTIFALSSGAPPAAIAVVRVSGPGAGHSLERLCGKLPKPREAKLASLRAADGSLLDQALVLWFPGPKSETGEDCAELQLHGGRAIVDAVYNELSKIKGFRLAAPGEFTRRAFANGQIDLLQVEGWRERLLSLAARVEAVLDFDDEGDVGGLDGAFGEALSALSEDLREALAAPGSEVLREGYRVALAGPPNS
jgi:tRNA modification GTPase